MAKSAMQEHRDGRERFVAVARHQIGADVEFTDVEFLIARHAPVAFSRPMPGQYHQVEAVRLHRALFERANYIVIAHGDRQPESSMPESVVV